MESAKKELLETTYREFMRVGLEANDPNLLEGLVDKNIMGFGTAMDEKIQGIEEFKKLLFNQKIQSQGLDIGWRHELVHLFISEDENSAVFAENLYATIKTDEEAVEMYMRFSSVLNYSDEQWKVVHFHGSKPEEVESEKDTWGIDIWKQKTKELEKLVEEKTADLVEKNRELEVEAALERVRAITMAMHSSADMGACILRMFDELTALGVDKGTRFGIGILNHENENNQLWTARVEGKEVKMHIGNLDMTAHPLLKRARTAWKAQVPFHQYVLEGQDLLDYYQMLNNAPDYKIHIPLEKLPQKEIQHCFIFEHGFFYAFSPIEFQPDLIQITKRFSAQFAQTYRRYLDLQKAENQAREAEIELALERIRARTMAMQSSDELAATASLLFQELQGLGISTYSSGFTIWDEEQKHLISWMCNADGSMNPPFRMPIVENDWHQRQFESWKKGESFLKKDFSGKEIQDYFKYLHSFPMLKKAFQKSMEAGFPLPERQIHHVANFASGNLLFITLEPLSGAEAIFQRFSKVFEQTYTRFLDLEKAENQAREAEIELALERVRARTMAMHKSEELSEVVLDLFEQMHLLGFAQWGSAIILADEPKNGFEFWFSTPSNRVSVDHYFFPNHGNPIAEKLWEDFKNQKELTILELKDQQKSAFDQWIFSETSLGKMPEKDKAEILSEPYAMFSYSSMKYGFINAISHVPIPSELSKILPRFSKVFEQTYTRFLDLQTAEELAKEAQIELSLERVRAKTMAMHTSKDVAETVLLLFNELVQLGLERNARCGIGILDDSKYMELWTASKAEDGKVSLTIGRLDMTLHPLLEGARSAWVQKKPGFTYVLEGQDLIAYYTILSQSKEYAIKVNFEKLPERHYHTDFTFADGLIFAFTKAPIPEEVSQIFQRFAALFGQTYRRYLDLLRAEAQAKEAEIQLALERVRARTMAMHKSEELSETAAVLFEQLRILGNTPERINLGIFKEEENLIEWWVTTQDGHMIEKSFITKFEDHQVLRTMFQTWKAEKKSNVIKLTGEELKGWIEYITKVLGMPVNPTMVKEQRILSSAYFAQGLIGTTTSTPLAHETLSLLERFAAVFQQTYTRFLDLQKVEAQAKEAKIQLALERVRARSMAMKSTEELHDVLSVLFRQFDEIGIHPMNVYLSLFDRENRTLTYRASGKSRHRQPQKQVVEVDSMEELKKIYDKFIHDQSEAVEVIFYSKEVLPQVFDIFSKTFDAMPEDERMRIEYFPEGGYSMAGYTPFGYLGYDHQRPATEEEKEILSRFCLEFTRVYQRFLDIQKAEAQAREAQIEVALEKIRSRTMGMQSSAELPKVANLLFLEVQALGIPAWSCGYCILQEDRKSSTCIMSSEGTLQKPFLLPHYGEASFEEWDDFMQGEQTFFTQELGGKAIERHYDYMKSLPQLTAIFKEIEEAGLSLPTYQINHLCKFTNGFLLFITYESVPEAHDIFKRFTKVFDQTYTRFLDLKKAETQAREAQIANALEKVRSRSLAMQSPDELIDVAQLLREEMGALGVEELETSSIYIHDQSSGLTQCWFTIKDTENPGKTVTDQMTINLQDTWVGRQMHKFYVSKKDRTSSILMKGDQRVEWIRYCEEKSELFSTQAFYGETIPERTYHLCKFSNGYLGAAAPGEISQESWDLLGRATSVFSFAYTRFQDLQKAEASALAARRQASLDRIRADISSMRHADDLDRITPLIFKELTVLGVPFIRCGVFIIQEEQEIIEAYLSSPDGNSLGALKLPYQASDLTYQTVKAWRKGEVLRQHWNKEDFVQWIKELMAKDQIQDSSTYQGSAAPPESLDLHFVPFAQGMLYIGSVSSLDEKELELVKALSEAFSIAFARYEDFVKLEQAKVEVESAMIELKSTQAQLIQSEKMASLGELTAGIAHEIQNPLNFVNNFSEVSAELVQELKEEIEKGDLEEVKFIANDLQENLSKINHHGKRAGSIVKGMLEHSRKSEGKKELTDLNQLAEECLRLSYHGLRAKDKSFQASFHSKLDPNLPKLEVVSQDIGRVLLNLINNAFYAVNEKASLRNAQGEVEYSPEVIVSSKKTENGVEISVHDNGNGIPDSIKEKIFQPFFTTKPTGSGTGLGLSLSYDIVKAHGGELTLDSQEDTGTVFSIKLYS